MSSLGSSPRSGAPVLPEGIPRHSRQHVYAFVTDLTTCWLLKAKASFPGALAHNCVSQEDIQLATFPWYEADQQTLTGLGILAMLGCQTPEELGMSSMYQFDRPVELRALGSGAASDVYELGFLDTNGKDVAVFKLAKSDPAQIEAEAAALKYINSLATVEGALEALKHVPMLLAATNLRRKHVRIRPVAVPLRHDNIDMAHIFELVQTLRWTRAQGWLHGDLSHRNLMLAEAGWRVKGTLAEADTYAYGSVNASEHASVYPHPPLRH